MTRFRNKAPVVGGPQHGQLVDLRNDQYEVYMLHPPAVHWSMNEADAVNYMMPPPTCYAAVKLDCILPGRTDRQLFRVAVHPDVRRANNTAQAIDAVTLAWAAGWSPDPDTSEVWTAPTGREPSPEYLARITPWSAQQWEVPYRMLSARPDWPELAGALSNWDPFFWPVMLMPYDELQAALRSRQ